MLTALFTVPTTSATDLLANVSSQFTDSGLWVLVLAVAAIPLVFYVIKKLIALVPKR